MHVPVAPHCWGARLGPKLPASWQGGCPAIPPTHAPGRHRQPLPEAGARAGGQRGGAEGGACC